MNPPASETPGELDVRHEVCPITYVRVKLALEEMAVGDCLWVLTRGDEPLVNIPKSALWDGHTVVEVRGDGQAGKVLLKKGRR